MFYRLKQTLAKNKLLAINYGIFHSIAVYGITRWEGLYDNSLDSLVRLQERLFNVDGIAEHDVWRSARPETTG